MRVKKEKREKKEEKKMGMDIVCYKAQMTWEVLSEI